MTIDFETGAQPSLLEPEIDGDVDPMFGSLGLPDAVEPPDDEPQRPINWFLLTANEAYAQWHALDHWVKRLLRDSYGLPPTVVPPFWYRHDELVWELSALRQHWLNSYDPEGSPSGPSGWHRDFADSRNRLREWVSTCGTRLDRDRPTRHTTWPGEPAIQAAGESVIEDRDADFVQFVIDDVNARRRIEQRVRSRAS